MFYEMVLLLALNQLFKLFDLPVIILKLSKPRSWAQVSLRFVESSTSKLDWDFGTDVQYAAVYNHVNVVQSTYLYHAPCLALRTHEKYSI